MVVVTVPVMRRYADDLQTNGGSPLTPFSLADTGRLWLPCHHAPCVVSVSMVNLCSSTGMVPRPEVSCQCTVAKVHVSRCFLL